MPWQDVLYLVVDGLDLFFNDVSEVAKSDESQATATARVIAERYEAMAPVQSECTPTLRVLPIKIDVFKVYQI